MHSAVYADCHSEKKVNSFLRLKSLNLHIICVTLLERLHLGLGATKDLSNSNKFRLKMKFLIVVLKTHENLYCYCISLRLRCGLTWNTSSCFLTLIAPGFWPPVTPWGGAYSATLPKSYFPMEFWQTVKSIA